MPFVRVRASKKPGKSHRAFEELKRSGRLTGFVVIAATGDDFQVIADMTLDAITDALYAAAQGVKHAREREDQTDSDVRLDPSLDVETIAPEDRHGRRRKPEVTRDPDGSLRAPNGEAFIFCAECGAARWFLTQLQHDFGPFARSVCARCGNELKFVTASPGQGHA
jgi:hypothetical protein